MRDLTLALFWLIAIPLTLMEPAAGITFWIWDALFSPTELAYGFMRGIETNKIIAIATMVSIALTARKRAFFIDRTGLLLLLLFVSATASYVFAIVPSSLNDELYVKLLKELVLAFAIMIVIDSRQWLYIAMLAVAVGIGFIGVKEGLIALLTAGGHQIVGTRSLGDNNQLASAIVSAMAITIGLWRCTASRPLKLGFIVSVFVSSVTVIMTFSRGGFVGLIVLAMLYLKGSNRRVIGILTLVAAGAAILMFAPSEWFHRVDTIQDASDDDSFMGRVIAWKISILIALDNPVFGGGFHAVQLLPTWRHYIPYFSTLSFIPTSEPHDAARAAHSIYFEVLGDLGFTGLFLYLALFFVGWLNCRAARRMAQKLGTMPWMIMLADATSAAIICYAVTGAALSIAYFDLFFLLIALSVCCRRIAQAAVNAPVQQDAEMAAAAEPARRRLAPAGVATRLPAYRFGAPRA